MARILNVRGLIPAMPSDRAELRCNQLTRAFGADAAGIDSPVGGLDLPFGANDLRLRNHEDILPSKRSFRYLEVNLGPLAHHRWQCPVPRLVPYRTIIGWNEGRTRW